LNQAASEEIRHTNQLFALLGHGENIERLLSALIREDNVVYEELFNLLETAPHAEETEELTLLQQMVQDSQRYKRWFRNVHKQTN